MYPPHILCFYICPDQCLAWSIPTLILTEMSKHILPMRVDLTKYLRLGSLEAVVTYPHQSYQEGYIGMYEVKREGKPKIYTLRVVSRHLNMRYEMTTL